MSEPNGMNDTILPDQVSCGASFGKSAQKSDPGGVLRKKGFFKELSDKSRLKANLPSYRKVKLLGQGSFGKAFLVEAISNDVPGSIGAGTKAAGVVAAQFCVLKRISLGRGISEEAREAAVREALLMRKISRGCPFIAQFSEVFVGRKGTQLCLIMEFGAGGDLRRELRERGGTKIPEEQVLGWTVQVALALRHCHGMGVLHRDVKPENCFFRSSGGGDLLLGDFGISCSLDDRSFAKTCAGSPIYMSPEIVDTRPYSFSCDVWSLGVLLYEALALEPPFKASNVCQLALKILTAEPAPLQGASAPLTSLVARLLEKDPSTRAVLGEVLLAAPLYAPACAACARYDLEWPPTGTGAAEPQRQSLVDRLRGRVRTAAPASGPDEEYADDFEAEDEDGLEAEYADDFEAEESDDEYVDDFESASEDEAPGLGPEALRAMLLAELGEEGLAVAESLGAVGFLEAMAAQSAGGSKPR